MASWGFNLRYEQLIRFKCPGALEIQLNPAVFLWLVEHCLHQTGCLGLDEKLELVQNQLLLLKPTFSRLLNAGNNIVGKPPQKSSKCAVIPPLV